MNNRLMPLFVIAAVAVLTVSLYLYTKAPHTSSKEPLLVYCAAGIKGPVAELAQMYESEYGVPVQLQYGGSGTLLANIEVAKSGDIFIAADHSYVKIAQERALIAETLPLAHLKPVVAVPTGNPKKIKALEDLLQPTLRVALGNPESASIGKLTQEMLTQAALWEKLKTNVEQHGVFKPTVPDIANAVQIGAADAAVVWDATVAQHKALEAIHLPLFNTATQEISACILTACKNPTAALRFARWLNSVNGNAIFKKMGYTAVAGDKWEVTPEITFFCGAVNRRAIDDVIKNFAAREGVTINTVYNGCGILTGQMKTIRQDESGAGFPDVYMACDRYYLDNVQEWFQEDVDISDADIVIAVPKGNPKNIKTLQDLTLPGMRVTVGQPEQCTIGALTQILLDKSGILAAVMSNVVMQTASSAMLVPTVTTRSADATIAYTTDTLAEKDKVDLIFVDSPFAKAIQPFSIATTTPYKHLGRRLYAALAASRKEFEAAGFHFRLENP